MTVLKKWRFVVNGNKHLGDLLFLKLHHGDHCLKLSLKNKVGPTLIKSGPHLESLREVDFSKPKLKKDVPEGVSLEISYIFEKHKLELKQEVVGDEIARSFYDVSAPVEHYLFTLIVRNMDTLNDVDDNSENLVLNEAVLGNQIAIVFSFEGEGGKPFMDPNITSQKGRQVVINLPGMLPNKLHLGIVADDNPMMEGGSFLVSLPYRPTKISG